MADTSLSMDAATPVLLGVGTGATVLGLSTKLLGASLGTSVTGGLAVIAGAALYLTGHRRAAFWALSFGAVAGVAGVVWTPVAIWVTGVYSRRNGWSIAQAAAREAPTGIDVDIGGQHLSVSLDGLSATPRPGAGVIEAEYEDMPNG